MAIKDLRDKATQLVSYGEYPALATRVSIPNVNLLSKKGSILYGTGKPATIKASINGETYQYAEVEALSGVDDVNDKSVLLNDGSGNLSWTNVVDNLTTNDGNKILSAKVGYDIDSKIHISEAGGGAGISMGYHSSSGTHAGNVAIGINATSSGSAGVSIGNVSWVTGDNSTAIGNAANALGDGCVAIGGAFHKSDTIKGGAAKAGTNDGSVYSAIQLGSGTNTTPYSFQVFNTPMLVDGKIPFEALSPEKNGDVGLVLSNGQTGKDMSYDGTVVLGPQAVAKGQEGIAIGAQAVASGNSIAIGGDAVYASSGGIAIGVGALAVENSIAIGNLAMTDVNETIQLGYNGDVNNNETGKYSLRIGRYPLMGNDGKINGNRLNIVKMAFGIFNLTVTVKSGSSSASQATAYITLSLVYKKSNDNMDVARLKQIISDSTSVRKSFICNGTINFGEAHYLIAEAWIANNKFYFGIPQGTTYEETSTTSSTLNDFGDIYVFNTLDVK